MTDTERLAELAARWRAIGIALQDDPDSPELAAQAQQVGSEALTLCGRLGG
jgi:hypothetical protein